MPGGEQVYRGTTASPSSLVDTTLLEDRRRYPNENTPAYLLEKEAHTRSEVQRFLALVDSILQVPAGSPLISPQVNLQERRDWQGIDPTLLDQLLIGFSAGEASGQYGSGEQFIGLAPGVGQKVAAHEFGHYLDASMLPRNTTGGPTWLSESEISTKLMEAIASSSDSSPEAFAHTFAQYLLRRGGVDAGSYWDDIQFPPIYNEMDSLLSLLGLLQSETPIGGEQLQ